MNEPHIQTATDLQTLQLEERFRLRERLRFDPASGHIWLDENRMVLLHARAFGALRQELFQSLGEERARSLLVRLGFASGQQDAALARKLIGDGEPHLPFLLGPALHALEGVANSRVVHSEINIDAGHFYGEFIWENSWEAEAHQKLFGTTDHPVCWSQIGYASGYVSTFMQRFVVFRETECAACGSEHCRIIGKPVEAWNAPEDAAYLKYFDASNIGAELAELQQQVDQLRANLRATLSAADSPAGGDLIGASPAFRQADELIQRAARTPINVLLLGETGVGKERFARRLHQLSERADRPFIAINCAAIPHDLIESELFGVEAGAYTGAHQARAGRFERADGGTLFLDEIGELSLAAQAKLLRVLQTGEVERLGSNQARKVNVRLVAATNVNLKSAISEGRFRTDLYYRISPYPVRVPPLRERGKDIALLAQAFPERFARLYKKELRGLSDQAQQQLQSYNWPGNIRELENLIERAVLLAQPGERLELSAFFGDSASSGRPLTSAGTLSSEQEEAEQRLAEQLLAQPIDWERFRHKVFTLATAKAGGNLSEAARRLGLSRRQLAYRAAPARPVASAADDTDQGETGP